MSIQYEELMSAELGISTKKHWQCGTCSTKKEVYFYFYRNVTIQNEIWVRCKDCMQKSEYLNSSTILTDKEVFLIKLRNDFN